MHKHNFGQTLKLQSAVVTVNITSRSLQSYSLFFLSTNKLHVAMQVWFRRQSSEKVEFKIFKDDDLEMR